MMTSTIPDFEGFAKAVLYDWPTIGIDGGVLFDLSVEYNMIAEIPGGYNPDHHIDADKICPETGDPWYEYTFRDNSGPGLYSISKMKSRIEELEAANRGLVRLNEATEARAKAAEAKLAKAVEALELLHGNVVQAWQSVADLGPVANARATLAELKGGKDE